MLPHSPGTRMSTKATAEVPTRRRQRLIRDWLEARTGYRRGLRILFGRELPDGPKWAYSTASCLFWLLMVQVGTGFLLMTTYSPSLASAWASVHFIEQQAAGAFLRGVHYFAAQAMIVLFAVHVVRVLVTGAFRAPRELVWISGLLLIPLVLVWAITGNPLSGSQRGLAQIEVEGRILGTTPLVGPLLQRILIGGETVGSLTITHLYFLHVALIPLLAGLLLAVHVWQVYRHGLSGMPQRDDRRHPELAPRPAARVAYWPHQSVRNMAVLSVVLGIIAALAVWVGAPLEMPADPEFAHMPRPEWYFLALFELRRHFTGPWEVVATVVLPLAVLLFLLCIPLIDAACSRRMSLLIRGGVVLCGCGLWGYLTCASLARDRADREYQASEAQLAELSARARELAATRGVPVEGASALLRNDPQTQGPRLFARHCAHCHSHADGKKGTGIIAAEPSAPNLFRFASREWIAGVLDPHHIAGDDYFGRTKARDGDMASYIRAEADAAAEAGAQAEFAAEMQTIALALSAQAARKDQADADRRDQSHIREGIRLMTEQVGCTDCHRFHDAGELGSAPDLTGYGSREWLLAFIADPTQERFYGKDRNDRMPAFHGGGAASGSPLLTRRELELLVDWLRGE